MNIEYIMFNVNWYNIGLYTAVRFLIEVSATDFSCIYDYINNASDVLKDLRLRSLTAEECGYILHWLLKMKVPHSTNTDKLYEFLIRRSNTTLDEYMEHVANELMTDGSYSLVDAICVRISDWSKFDISKVETWSYAYQEAVKYIQRYNDKKGMTYQQMIEYDNRVKEEEAMSAIITNMSELHIWDIDEMD